MEVSDQMSQEPSYMADRPLTRLQVLAAIWGIKAHPAIDKCPLVTSTPTSTQAAVDSFLSAEDMLNAKMGQRALNPGGAIKGC